MTKKFELDENGIPIPLENKVINTELNLDKIQSEEFKSNFKGSDAEYNILLNLYKNRESTPKIEEIDESKYLTEDNKIDYKELLDDIEFKNNPPQFHNALKLYSSEIEEVPKLLDPFLQKVGLASIVGSSDTGKSSFLRQLALSVALGKDEFLGFKLNTQHKKVIYVSTEDDPNSTNAVIKKQLKSILGKSDIKNLQNLNFIFDTEKLLKALTVFLKDNPHDLIIIDAFADVFSDEINSNTKVRQFLQDYHNLARKNECLIIFLHHIGKRTDRGLPSKDNIIGSQAFEAKMRSVLNLSHSIHNKDERYLTLLKCNFLSSEFKSKNYVLNFNKNLIFKNTNKKISINATQRNNKKDNSKIVSKVMDLSINEKLSVRKIEEKLKGTELGL